MAIALDAGRSLLAWVRVLRQPCRPEGLHDNGPPAPIAELLPSSLHGLAKRGMLPACMNRSRALPRVKSSISDPATAWLDWRAIM